eukprot:TRINITY_DN13005_c0_g2_i8.p1 TRINITY_DN13005_c0_g2~~TRINITY_DN13005_c0_g2_i8.p1  ORF type:complete len:505 (+),score=132.09 TRINITY_DN13005_c0_g2_i8:138-1517(+)
MLRSLVGSEMCIRDRYQRRVRGLSFVSNALRVGGQESMGCGRSDENGGDRYMTSPSSPAPLSERPPENPEDPLDYHEPESLLPTDPPKNPEQHPPAVPAPIPTNQELDEWDEQMEKELAAYSPDLTAASPPSPKNPVNGWKVKPRGSKIRRRPAARLSSLETWRSDLIDAAEGRNPGNKNPNPKPHPAGSRKMSIVAPASVSKAISPKLAPSISPGKIPVRAREKKKGSPGVMEESAEDKPVVRVEPELGDVEPSPHRERPSLKAPTIERAQLGGKLMETDALLRDSFSSEQELSRVEERVRDGIALLDELPKLAAQGEVLEGGLFQELLQRLAISSTMKESTNMLHTPKGVRRSSVITRTPIKGSRRAHSCVSMACDKLFGEEPDMLAALLQRVHRLRELLRIKIEDNKDLDLARDALREVEGLIRNLWWYAEESGGQPKSSTGAERVAGLLSQLRAS